MIGFRRRTRTAAAAVETRRLRLVPITPELVQAEATGASALGEALGAEIGADWPPEHWGPHVRAHILGQFMDHPDTVGWHRYMVLTGPPDRLVGCLGAFPCAAGDVEIGYSVVDSFQRRGLGTEAALAFVEWLLEQPSIHSVTAQSYVTTPASIKVMERCGMRRIGPGDQPGTVRYRRWRAVWGASARG